MGTEDAGRLRVPGKGSLCSHCLQGPRRPAAWRVKHPKALESPKDGGDFQTALKSDCEELRPGIRQALSALVPVFEEFLTLRTGRGRWLLRPLTSLGHAGFTALPRRGGVLGKTIWHTPDRWWLINPHLLIRQLRYVTATAEAGSAQGPGREQGTRGRALRSRVASLQDAPRLPPALCSAGSHSSACCSRHQRRSW